jgi:hypothetical protein
MFAPDAAFHCCAAEPLSQSSVASSALEEKRVATAKKVCELEGARLHALLQKADAAAQPIPGDARCYALVHACFALARRVSGVSVDEC